jgi:MFS family permease
MPLLIAGAGLMAAGVLLTGLSTSTSAGYLVLSYLVFGIGMGTVNAPITNSAVSGMPRAQAGVAAGIASASRQVGQVLGVAVVGSVLTANLHGSLHSGFAAASRPGWWIVAACGFAVIALALVATGRRGRATAAKAASLVSTTEEAEKVPAWEARRLQAPQRQADDGVGGPSELADLLVVEGEHEGRARIRQAQFEENV